MDPDGLDPPIGGGVPASLLPPPPASPSSPQKPRALLVGSIIAIALVVFLIVVLHPKADSGTSSGSLVTVGSTAPEFSIPSLTGSSTVNLDQLGSDRGHPVVLNFFASWCVPCRKETPLLARAAKVEQAKDSSIQFVGVDVADARADAIPFVEKSGLNYPVGSDNNLRVSATLYGLNGEPNTFFIDGSDHVIGHVIGAMTSSQLDGWLHRLGGATKERQSSP